MRGGADTGARRTTGSPRLRAAGLAAGCLLAVAATAVVFLTEDPQVLRIAVVAVAWACLLAAAAAGRRRDAHPDDGPDAAAVEAELRRAYDRELEREVAARQRYELELESQVRREAEESVRRELDALRAELAGLREGLSGLPALRAELAAVGALRADLAELTALRADLAELTALRTDLAELAGLRADVGRLRAELTEQVSGQMRVERVVMHAQSVRTAPGRETLEPATSAWGSGIPAGWPVLSLDDAPAPETTAVPQVTATPAPAPVVAPQPAPVDRPLPPVPAPGRETTGSPREWLATRGLLADPLDADPLDAEPRRRRTDPPGTPTPLPAEQLTVERPAVHTASAGHATAGRPAPATPVDDAGSSRLAQILAESGVTPGGRRHRYRD